MSFKELRKLIESEEARKKAAEGFEERQREREKRFAEEAKRLEPSAAWYERSYDL